MTKYIKIKIKTKLKQNKRLGQKKDDDKDHIIHIKTRIIFS